LNDRPGFPAVFNGIKLGEAEFAGGEKAFSGGWQQSKFPSSGFVLREKMR
jgi:hypothetical protein